jgi:hypothetical protein
MVLNKINKLEKLMHLVGFIISKERSYIEGGEEKIEIKDRVRDNRVVTICIVKNFVLCTRHLNYFVLPWRNNPKWARAVSLSHSDTFGRTPLDK